MSLRLISRSPLDTFIYYRRLTVAVLVLEHLAADADQLEQSEVAIASRLAAD